MSAQTGITQREVTGLLNHLMCVNVMVMQTIIRDKNQEELLKRIKTNHKAASIQYLRLKTEKLAEEELAHILDTVVPLEELAPFQGQWTDFIASCETNDVDPTDALVKGWHKAEHVHKADEGV